MTNRILKYAIPLYVFLLPWQARYLFAEYSLATLYYGGLSFYLMDAFFLFIGLIFGVWLSKNHRDVRTQLKQLSKRAKIVLALAGLFLIYSFISIWWGGFSQLELVKWARLLQAVLFMGIIAIAPIRLRSIFLAIIAAGIWQALWAMQQFFLQEIPANTWLGVAEQKPADLGVSVIEYDDQRWLRAYGGFPHPNILGAFLTLGGLAVSAWIFDVYKQIGHFKGRWQEITIKEIRPIRLQVIASLTAFCFILIGLLFSFSRTAWLGFACGWVLLFFALIYFAKTKYIKKLMIIAGFKQIIAGVLILGALTMIIGPLWTERANDMSRLGQRSTMERSELIEQAQQVIDVNPVWGVGIGSYSTAIREINPDQEIFAYQPVHNLWLLLWAELGIIGLLPFLLFVLFILRLLQVVSKKSHLSLNKILTIVLLLSIGVMVYFEHFWWTLVFGQMILFTCLGLYLRNQLEN